MEDDVNLIEHCLLLNAIDLITKSQWIMIPWEVAFTNVRNVLSDMQARLNFLLKRKGRSEDVCSLSQPVVTRKKSKNDGD